MGSKIALCLSGGGNRAILFHLGALKRLNELGILARLDRVSSVSGGSVVAGVLAMNWSKLESQDGVFSNFKEVIAEPLEKFASDDIRTAALITGRIDPRNWLHLANAAVLGYAANHAKGAPDFEWPAQCNRPADGPENASVLARSHERNVLGFIAV